MARPGLFHRQDKHADENHPETDVNHAETRDPYPGGPAVVGHDDNVERPHRATSEVSNLHEGDRVEHYRHTEDGRRAALHDTYGGINWGACFFGWLVAVGVTFLLGAIISAVASAIGSDQNWTRADLQSMADSVGIAAAITLAVVMFIGYFAGGYVAARMSRFDARRQGLGVWIVAIVVMIIAAVAGALFGSNYNIMQQVDLPNVGLSTDQLGWGAVITAVVLLAVMLVGALLGAATGQRYHTKIDRAAYED
ncbi:APC family permease [Nocardioides sp. KC13]|uniref:APC family permease n=1 Tax=Nocardioides turkmenicus TaxID=2711220 RepID=A0A6M1QP63_9ACTN|nr:APC family permease [Nocardioides sp. KC13]NGN91463.1 APC family permease [Nocardioides sp. KC13]